MTGRSSNGISIQAETNAALAGKTLDFSAPNFDVLAAALLPAGKTLVSAANAGDALKSTLLAVYSGSYSCTYSGIINNVNAVSGTVAVSITSDTLTGIGTPTYPTTGTPFDVDGSITPGGGQHQHVHRRDIRGQLHERRNRREHPGSGNLDRPGVGSGTWSCQHT